MVATKRQQRLRSLYSTIITIVGVIFALWGIWLLPTYNNPLNLILLICLAAVSEVAATFLTPDEDTIAYEVGTAVSIAAIPLFGPAAAALSVSVAGLSFWLYKNRGTPWRERNLEVLRFNIGMHSMAIFIAGSIFLLIQSIFGKDSFFGQVLPWIVAAIIYDQINIWLLIIIIKLSQGDNFNPIEFWKANRWAMVINIAILSIGGFLLAFAIIRFDWIGVVIFFLPIILSSFAFSLYVKQMRAHMNNLEHIVAERTQALQDLMDEKDKFLAVLTHDMKTPLTNIGLGAEMLDNKDQSGFIDDSKVVDIILRNQRTLVDIVNNILDLEKLNNDGMMFLEKESVDLGLLAEIVCMNVQPQALSKDIEVMFEGELETVFIYADRGQIERVLHNLVSNGIKYTPREGAVTVRLANDGDTAVLQVIDTGYGIPADDLPHVFDPYRRVAKHKNVAAGTGLGLAITQALIEAHQGTIRVTSIEGEGSTFTMKLPLIKEPS